MYVLQLCNVYTYIFFSSNSISVIAKYGLALELSCIAGRKACHNSDPNACVGLLTAICYIKYHVNMSCHVMSCDILIHV